MKQPKIFPNNRPYKFRLWVQCSGRNDGGYSRYWWRVTLHASRVSMHRHFDRNGMNQETGVEALCSSSSRYDSRKDGCIGSLNFYYPGIGPGIVSHELTHAVLDTLSYFKIFDIVPPAWYVRRGWHYQPKKKFERAQQRHELTAYMMHSFMQQFHDECIKRGLWNK